METLTGEDSLVVDNQVLEDLANGDCVNIEFSNDIVSITKGKNGNTIYSFNSQGEIVNVSLRCILNGKTDKYLNNKYLQYKNSPTTFTLMNATFTKRTGDGKGNQTKKIFNLTGGVVSRPANVVDSTDGNVESAVAVYNLQFASSNPTNN